MIRSLLTISVPAEQGPEVIARYAELGVLEAAIRESGALSCELSQSTSDPGSLIAVALWETSADYENWLAHPVRQRNIEAMSDIAMVPSGSVYEVRAVATAQP